MTVHEHYSRVRLYTARPICNFEGRWWNFGFRVLYALCNSGLQFLLSTRREKKNSYQNIV